MSVENQTFATDTASSIRKDTPVPTLLKWNLDEGLKRDLASSVKAVRRLIEDTDFKTMKLMDYGRDFIKIHR